MGENMENPFFEGQKKISASDGRNAEQQWGKQADLRPGLEGVFDTCGGDQFKISSELALKHWDAASQWAEHMGRVGPDKASWAANAILAHMPEKPQEEGEREAA